MNARGWKPGIDSLETSMKLILGSGLLCLALLGGSDAGGMLRAGEGRLAAKPNELPSHLKWVREHPSLRPPPEIRRAVRAEDEDWLILEYRRQPTLPQRAASAWLLAYVGDDEVFRLFSETLRLGPGREPIDRSAMGNCYELLFAMGVMAQTNDLAFQFLKEAGNPDWWAKERKWREKREDVQENVNLAATAVYALGLSARSEVDVILDRVRAEGFRYVSPTDPRANSHRGIEVYTAKRYLGISRKMGLQAFRDGLFGSEFKRYSMEWRKSEEGMKWFEWCCPKDRWPDLWRDRDAFFEQAEKTSD